MAGFRRDGGEIQYPSKSIIKNKGELSTTRLRKIALEIIESGIERVLPSNIIQESVKYDSKRRILFVMGDKFEIGGRIFIIGGGKASGLMAETFEKIVNSDIAAGYINCVDTEYSTEKIKILKASHPVPNQNGVEGVKKMLALKNEYRIDANDVIICLISGGGSALMPYPAEGVSLEDKQETTKLLLNCGAEIEEINTVRKHLSRVKGGQLGRHFSPSRVISLIISDVIGNKLDVIASGLTTPDLSTFSNALAILKKYGLIDSVPENVIEHLRKGDSGYIPETPKSLDNCKNYIIGDLKMALDAMKEKSVQYGLNPVIVTSEQKGETTEVARMRAKEIKEGKYSKFDVILLGGETTPVLPENHGEGGRNQHYVAVSMIEFEKYADRWVIASAGTDGSDFTHEYAGAIADRSSVSVLEEKGLNAIEYIERYDSNTLLRKIGRSLIVTGNTGTNVGDVIVYIFQQN
jgi:hydroxypyruvate reductase/glycerate 2-kinase